MVIFEWCVYEDLIILKWTGNISVKNMFILVMFFFIEKSIVYLLKNDYT